MKQITELTEKEILALTDDQLKKMVKLKMAEAGIKIIDEPIEPVYEELPAKTDQWYSITGCEYLTQDKEFAEVLGLTLKNSALKFGTSSYIGNDYTHKFIKRLDDYAVNNSGNVSLNLYYNPKEAETVKNIISNNKLLKAEYGKQLDEWKENQEAVNLIKHDIYGVFQGVDKKYWEMDDMKRKYQQYLDLADGNQITAMKFLKNAYVIDKETENYVKHGFSPDMLTEG